MAQKSFIGLLPNLCRQTLVQKVVRVNHAAEYVTCDIYAGQILASKGEGARLAFCN